MIKDYVIQVWIDTKQEWYTLLKYEGNHWHKDEYTTIEEARARLDFLKTSDPDTEFRIAVQTCTYEEVK